MNKFLSIFIVLIVVIILISLNNGDQSSSFNQDSKKTYLNGSSNENNYLLIQNILEEKEKKYDYARELQNPSGYINADNFTLSEIVGKKVILIDFWTYSCINCQRTIPYLNSWYERYHDSGLEIVSIHTPEFDFEKDYDNVAMAVEKYGIQYSVVLDNEYATFRAYENRFWPRKYLIDIDGFIIYDHAGEGKYDETESKIREALHERNQRLNQTNNILTDETISAYSPDYFKIRTREIYLGYAFSRNQFGNIQGWSKDKTISYRAPSDLELDKFYLEGKWKNNPDAMESVSNGSIFLNYKASNINLVAGSDDGVMIDVYIDNVKVNQITIKDYDLYRLYTNSTEPEHSIEIRSPPGLRAYTFTFG